VKNGRLPTAKAFLGKPIAFPSSLGGRCKTIQPFDSKTRKTESNSSDGFGSDLDNFFNVRAQSGAPGAFIAANLQQAIGSF